jgi:peptide/nickel transport system permease protein
MNRAITWLACAVAGLWGLVALFGSLLPLSPNAVDLSNILAPPGAAHWLGCDDLGRDILHRLIAGARTAAVVAMLVTTVTGVLGIAIGTVAAWSPPWLELTIVRIMDVFLAFPGMLLAIAFAAVLGPGALNAVLALSMVGWVGFARLARAQAASLRCREHVAAATALGTPASWILLRHVLPLAAAPLIVEATFAFASAIVAEAGLSFLGLGVQPPAPSWGSMIRDGVSYMLVAPHAVTGPALVMAITVLAINTLGDALRDAMDVRIDPRAARLG